MRCGQAAHAALCLTALIAATLYAHPAAAQTCISGGSDGDTDFDLIDVAAFQRCFGETAVGECLGLDLDGSAAIDLPDLAVLVARANGPIGVLPTVDFSQPASPTTSTTATIAGTAEWSCTVEILGGVGNSVVPVVNGAFSANIDLHPNSISHLFVTGIASNGTRGSPTPVSVTHDGQAPTLFIDFPASSADATTAMAEITTATTDVAGRVSDMLSGFNGLTVVINGDPTIPVEIDIGIGTNGTFFAPAVPLAVGPNTIQAVASDMLGNTSVVREITVTRIEVPPDAPQMAVVSGNGGTSQAGTALSEPIVVQVAHDDMTNPDGTPVNPFANKIVTFDVTRSNGRLAGALGQDCTGDGSMMLQCRTDNVGRAAVLWTLGFDAGCGNNRVEVTSNDIVGTTAFCASATPAPAAQINIGSGNNQRAEAGGPAAEPLRVWVNDACNGVSGIPVTFTVTQGGGAVNGAITDTIVTSDTGHVAVDFTLGPDRGNNIVEATFPSNPGAPATFVTFGLVRDVAMPTSFSGLILNNASQPVEGATCRLLVGANAMPEILSGPNGQFRFDGLTNSGPAKLFIDGLTATAVNGQPIPEGSFPALAYETLVVPNAENSLPTPVLLPPMNPANAMIFDNTQDVELTVEGIDGLKMIVKAGSMTRADGTVPSPSDPAIIALNQVHADDIPMPMPDGASPPFAWTLQPAGAMFDPPVEITYPNMSGLPPGSIAFFLSFNHDTNLFEIVATGTVTDDGLCILSDPGVGITKAGWGCNCPPYSATGSCEDCPDDDGGGAVVAIGGAEEECTANGCTGVPDCPSASSCFTCPCNNHDRCYWTCGKTKLECDLDFFFDMMSGGCALDISCSNAAAAYFAGVTALGLPFWNAAQEHCPQLAQEDSGVDYNNSLGVDPPTDEDQDGMGDDWELMVGLDPNDPSDGELDPDSDDLRNRFEYVFDLDPFNPDSNGDGVDDGAEAERMQRDESWIYTVNGQAVSASSTGTLKVSNIASPDFFGDDGPGSPPDFVGDDFVRVTGISTAFGVTRYAFSEFFQIVQGQTYSIQEMTVTDTPPPFPESLSLTAADSVILVGGTTQLTTIAHLADGTQQDITPRTSWTTYRVSNPAIATVDALGVVTGHTAGPVLITASNEGAISVTRIDVTTQIVSTTFTGFVQLSDLTAVGSATVGVVDTALGFLVLAFGETVADGSFAVSVNDIPVEPTMIVSVVGVANGVLYSGQFPVPPLVPDGFSDLGIVTLTPVIEDAFSREFSVYNDVFVTDPVDAWSREFSVFNNPMLDMIDAISREFSVFNDMFDQLMDSISREFSVHNETPP